MGIWNSIASFIDNHLGKISLITDIATVFGIVSTVFLCPTSGVIYGIAWAGCSIGLVASGGFTSTWVWREYINNNKESNDINQIDVNIKKLEQDFSDYKTKTEARFNIQDNKIVAIEKLIETTVQKVGKVETNLEAQIAFESQMYTFIQQSQMDMLNNFSSHVPDEKSLKDNQSKVTNNRNAMFTQTKESTRSVDQAQSTQQFQ